MKTHKSLPSLQEALSRLPGFPASFVVSAGSQADSGSEAAFTLPSGQAVGVGIEQKLSTPVVERIILNNQGSPFLVFSPYVSPTFAERLRKHNIFFIDETGNAFLQWPGYTLFVSRDVPRKDRPGGNHRKPVKDFSPNALKLIYAFLTDTAAGGESLVNQTVRLLSKATGVSTGSISGVMESLKAQGFVEEREPGLRKVVNREILMERWVQDYARKLRPKLPVEHFRLPHAAWAGEAMNTPKPGLWGGEIAGARLTGYLVPETATLYANGLSSDFIVTHDLRKDPAGRFEVLRPFWPEDRNPSLEGCVHPLIVYADLMATESDRNLETAKRIYEKYLRSLATSD